MENKNMCNKKRIIYKGLLLFLSGFLVISCSNQNSNAIATVIKDVRHEETINLLLDSQKLPHTIKIRIYGAIDGPANVEIFNEEGLQYTNEIKKGNVNLAINKEWYSDTCFIKYIPTSSVTGGDLKVEYRVGYVKK